MKTTILKIKNVNDIEKIESQWKSIQNGRDMTIYQSYEWNKLLLEEWYNSFNVMNLSEIIIVLCENDKSEIMIAPMLVQKKSQRMVRKKGIYILGYGSYSDYLNFIYKDFNSQLFEACINQIKRMYKDLDIWMTDVREDTLLWENIKNSEDFEIDDVSVSIKIPFSAEEYNKQLSKHTRQNLRTALNRMNKDDMRYSWEKINGVIDIEIAEKLRLLHIKRLPSKNYNRSRPIVQRLKDRIKIKLLVHKEKNNNIIYNSMISLDNSFSIIVKLKGEIVGYIYGLMDKEKTVRIMQNCVDEGYAFYSPMFRGIYDYILYECDAKKIKELDFTRGDEEYKYKLAGVETKLYKLKIK